MSGARWRRRSNDRNDQTHPEPHDIPIGIRATGTRRETDSMGEIEVPADRYRGAQTQRSLVYFSIGDDRMPKRVYRAYGYVEKATALVNAAAGRLPQWKAEAIVRAADEAIAGKLDDHFPLCVWQTGSGTQSNMNANEMLSNRGDRIARRQDRQQGDGAPQRRRHYGAVVGRHLPDRMDGCGQDQAHTSMDAVPLAVGQEWSGWAHQIRDTLAHIRASETELFEFAAGGTAVGTGLSAPSNFGREIAELTVYPFVTAPNKFAAQGSLDGTVAAMAAVRGLAVALMKIANDMRWLASGPRCGLSELLLPENKPGSSMPAQQKAMVMVCIQVSARIMPSHSPAARAISSSALCARTSSTISCIRLASSAMRTRSWRLFRRERAAQLQAY